MLNKINKNNNNLDNRMNTLIHYLQHGIMHKGLKLIPRTGKNAQQLDIVIDNQYCAFITINSNCTLLTVNPVCKGFIFQLERILTNVFNQPVNFSYSFKGEAGINNEMPSLEWVHQGSILKRWAQLNQDSVREKIIDPKMVSNPYPELYEILLSMLELIPMVPEQEIFNFINIIEGCLLNTNYYFSNGESLNVKSDNWADLFYLREECIKQLPLRFNISSPEDKPLEETKIYAAWYDAMYQRVGESLEDVSVADLTK